MLFKTEGGREERVSTTRREGMQSKPRGEIPSRPRDDDPQSDEVASVGSTETREPRTAPGGVGNDTAAAGNRRKVPPQNLF